MRGEPKVPKKTFYNLSEEKRNIIIETAIDEFASDSFKNASISKIAERAGIAKGSLYQYFIDKKDLYKHIIEISGNKKLEYLTDCIARIEGLKLFELIRELYKQGILFTIENPKLASITNNFLKETDTRFKEEILGTNMEKSNQFFEMLIEKSKQKGEVKNEIDTKVGAYIITHLNTAIVDQVLNHMEFSEILLNQEELLDKVDKMLFILESGFNS